MAKISKTLQKVWKYVLITLYIALNTITLHPIDNKETSDFFEMLHEEETEKIRFESATATSHKTHIAAA